MKQISLFLIVMVTCLVWCMAADANKSLIALLKNPIPSGSKSISYVEITKNDQYQNVFTGVARIECSKNTAVDYLIRCGFKSQRYVHFPLNIPDGKAPWWPSKIEGDATRYIRDDGKNGYISSIWMGGFLFFFFDRQ